MIVNSIREVEGCHLTAADRKNIKAIFAHPGFSLGTKYRANNRKFYTIEAADGLGRFRVLIGSKVSTWQGTKDERGIAWFTAAT